MTAEEEDRIRAIVHAVVSEERKQREADAFYISRKNLYDTHQRTVSVLKRIDEISEIVGKTIVYSFIVGAAGLVIWALTKIKGG